MKPEYAWILIVSLFWGGYPLIARGANLGGPLGALILSAVSLIDDRGRDAGGRAGSRWPAPAAAIRLVDRGRDDGHRPARVQRRRREPADRGVGRRSRSWTRRMLLVSVLAAVVFFAEPITLRKCVGLALLVAGIVASARIAADRRRSARCRPTAHSLAAHLRPGVAQRDGAVPDRRARLGSSGSTQK